MPRGGARPGAGRRKGKSFRAKVVKQIAPEIRGILEIVGDGPLPLEYLVSVYRDEQADPLLRAQCAIAASPYIHKKQPQDKNITHLGDCEKPVALVLSAPPPVKP